MKKTILTLLFCPLLIISQVTGWINKPSLPDSARANAFYFQINDKFYVGGGQKKTNLTVLKDFWEYNTTTDTWTKKNDFGGSARAGSTGFSYNGKGYIIGGTDYLTQASKDVWEYNPATDAWIQKTSMSGGVAFPYCFVINNKAYIGGPFNSLLQYDIVSDSWSTKANPPVTTNAKQGFSIGTSGYMISDSVNYPFIYSQLYEYNSLTDVWSKKNKPPFNTTYGACLSYDGHGFIIGGNGFITGYSTAYYQSLFKKYNPISDTWSDANPTAVPAAPYQTGNGVIFAHKNRIYYGLGFMETTSNIPIHIPYTNTFWETTFDVGIMDHYKTTSNLVVYPQPSSDKISIRVPDDFGLISEIKILNSTGVEINLNRIIVSKNSESIEISSLPEGIYLINLKNIKGKIANKKIIMASN